MASKNTAAHRNDGKRGGAHRAPRRQQSMVVRTAAVGGAFACIGLAAEVGVPDADALSILLPSGKGNATQINILEGNVFRPQFGLGGDGSNTSDNKTLSNYLLGLGGQQTTQSTKSRLFGPIVLGGATGTGNITQINIVSYNIFNPQVSARGGNTSSNTTVSNVAIGNGNGEDTTVTGSDEGMTLIGGAAGNGNSTQISIFSSNIFNPQISLFGDNWSNNTAITNAAGINGNGSSTSARSNGLFGTSLFGGVIGNGNTNQVAAGSTNIFNPQFSLLGRNTSHNKAITNLSFLNGNFSKTSTTSGGFLGTSLFGGTTGNGNTNQLAAFVSNLFNPQLSISGSNLSNNLADTNRADSNGSYSNNEVSSDGANNTVVGTNGNGNTNQTGYGTGNISNDQLRILPSPDLLDPPDLTNAQVTSGTEEIAATGEELMTTGNQTARQQPKSGVGTRTPTPGRLGSRIAGAIDRTSNAVKKALGLDRKKNPSTNTTPSGDQNQGSTE